MIKKKKLKETPAFLLRPYRASARQVAGCDDRDLNLNINPVIPAPPAWSVGGHPGPQEQTLVLTTLDCFAPPYAPLRGFGATSRSQ